MANNTLTSEQRAKWRVLYRYGWRCEKDIDTGKWIVVDDRGRVRSSWYRNRDHAVAEVVS